jgi:hypothetical protein
MPQVTVNKRKWKEAIEALELSRELAKQVLCSVSDAVIRNRAH